MIILFAPAFLTIIIILFFYLASLDWRQPQHHFAAETTAASLSSGLRENVR